MSSSDKRGLNDPKNKSYLRGALNKLAKKSVDVRVAEVLKRVDNNLTPKNPQRPKKVCFWYVHYLTDFSTYILIFFLHRKPNTRNWTRVHATPTTGSTTPK